MHTTASAADGSLSPPLASPSSRNSQDCSHNDGEDVLNLPVYADTLVLDAVPSCSTPSQRPPPLAQPQQPATAATAPAATKRCCNASGISLLDVERLRSTTTTQTFCVSRSAMHPAAAPSSPLSELVRGAALREDADAPFLNIPAALLQRAVPDVASAFSRSDDTLGAAAATAPTAAPSLSALSRSTHPAASHSCVRASPAPSSETRQPRTSPLSLAALATVLDANRAVVAAFMADPDAPRPHAAQQPQQQQQPPPPLLQLQRIPALPSTSPSSSAQAMSKRGRKKRTREHTLAAHGVRPPLSPQSPLAPPASASPATSRSASHLSPTAASPVSAFNISFTVAPQGPHITAVPYGHSPLSMHAGSLTRSFGAAMTGVVPSSLHHLQNTSASHSSHATSPTAGAPTTTTTEATAMVASPTMPLPLPPQQLAVRMANTSITSTGSRPSAGTPSFILPHSPLSPDAVWAAGRGFGPAVASSPPQPAESLPNLVHGQDPLERRLSTSSRLSHSRPPQPGLVSFSHLERVHPVPSVTSVLSSGNRTDAPFHFEDLLDGNTVSSYDEETNRDYAAETATDMADDDREGDIFDDALSDRDAQERARSAGGNGRRVRRLVSSRGSGRARRQKSTRLISASAASVPLTPTAHHPHSQQQEQQRQQRQQPASSATRDSVRGTEDGDSISTGNADDPSAHGLRSVEMPSFPFEGGDQSNGGISAAAAAASLVAAWRARPFTSPRSSMVSQPVTVDSASTSTSSHVFPIVTTPSGSVVGGGNSSGRLPPLFAHNLPARGAAINATAAAKEKSGVSGAAAALTAPLPRAPSSTTVTARTSPTRVSTAAAAPRSQAEQRLRSVCHARLVPHTGATEAGHTLNSAAADVLEGSLSALEMPELVVAVTPQSTTEPTSSVMTAATTPDTVLSHAGGAVSTEGEALLLQGSFAAATTTTASSQVQQPQVQRARPASRTGTITSSRSRSGRSSFPVEESRSPVTEPTLEVTGREGGSGHATAEDSAEDTSAPRLHSPPAATAASVAALNGACCGRPAHTGPWAASTVTRPPPLKLTRRSAAGSMAVAALQREETAAVRDAPLPAADPVQLETSAQGVATATVEMNSADATAAVAAAPAVAAEAVTEAAAIAVVPVPTDISSAPTKLTSEEGKLGVSAATRKASGNPMPAASRQHEHDVAPEQHSSSSSSSSTTAEIGSMPPIQKGDIIAGAVAGLDAPSQPPRWRTRLLWILLPYGVFAVLLALATFVATHVVAQRIVSQAWNEQHTYMRSELVAFMEEVTLLPVVSGEIITARLTKDRRSRTALHTPRSPILNVSRALCAALKFTDLSKSMTTLSYAALSSTADEDDLVYLPARVHNSSIYTSGRGTVLRQLALDSARELGFPAFLENASTAKLKQQNGAITKRGEKRFESFTDDDADPEVLTAFAFCDAGHSTHYYATGGREAVRASNRRSAAATAPTIVYAVNATTLDVLNPLRRLTQVPPCYDGNVAARIAHVLPLVHAWKTAVARNDGSQARISHWWISSEPFERPSITYVQPFYEYGRREPSYVACRMDAEVLLRSYVAHQQQRPHAVAGARVMLIVPRRRAAREGTRDAARGGGVGPSGVRDEEFDVVARSWALDLESIERRAAAPLPRADPDTGTRRCAAPNATTAFATLSPIERSAVCGGCAPDINDFCQLTTNTSTACSRGAGEAYRHSGEKHDAAGAGGEEEEEDSASWLPWFFYDQPPPVVRLEKVDDALMQAALRVVDVPSYAAEMRTHLDAWHIAEASHDDDAPKLGDDRRTFMHTVFREFYFEGHRAAVSVSAVQLRSNFSVLVVLATPLVPRAARGGETLLRYIAASAVALVAAGSIALVYLVLTCYVQLPLIAIQRQLELVVVLRTRRAAPPRPAVEDNAEDAEEPAPVGAPARKQEGAAEALGDLLGRLDEGERDATQSPPSATTTTGENVPVTEEAERPTAHTAEVSAASTSAPCGMESTDSAAATPASPLLSLPQRLRHRLRSHARRLVYFFMQLRLSEVAELQLVCGELRQHVRELQRYVVEEYTTTGDDKSSNNTAAESAGTGAVSTTSEAARAHVATPEDETAVSSMTERSTPPSSVSGCASSTSLLTTTAAGAAPRLATSSLKAAKHHNDSGNDGRRGEDGDAGAAAAAMRVGGGVRRPSVDASQSGLDGLTRSHSLLCQLDSLSASALPARAGGSAFETSVLHQHVISQALRRGGGGEGTVAPHDLFVPADDARSGRRDPQLPPLSRPAAAISSEASPHTGKPAAKARGDISTPSAGLRNMERRVSFNPFAFIHSTQHSHSFAHNEGDDTAHPPPTSLPRVLRTPGMSADGVSSSYSQQPLSRDTVTPPSAAAAAVTSATTSLATPTPGCCPGGVSPDEFEALPLSEGYPGSLVPAGCDVHSSAASCISKCFCTILSIHVLLHDPFAVLPHFPEIMHTVEECVHRYGGTFDVLVPEMMYASFGSRVRMKDHAVLATRCGIEIFSRLSTADLRFLTFVIDTGVFAVGVLGVPEHKGFVLWGRSTGALIFEQQFQCGFRFFVTDAAVPLLRQHFRLLPVDVVTIEEEAERPNLVLYLLLVGSVHEPWWDGFNELAHEAFLHLIRGNFEAACPLYERLIHTPSVTFTIIFQYLLVHERVLMENKAGLSPTELARQLDELTVTCVNELSRERDPVVMPFGAAMPWIVRHPNVPGRFSDDEKDEDEMHVKVGVEGDGETEEEAAVTGVKAASAAPACVPLAQQEEKEEEPCDLPLSSLSFPLADASVSCEAASGTRPRPCASLAATSSAAPLAVTGTVAAAPAAAASSVSVVSASTVASLSERTQATPKTGSTISSATPAGSAVVAVTAAPDVRRTGPGPCDPDASGSSIAGDKDSSSDVDDASVCGAVAAKSEQTVTSPRGTADADRESTDATEEAEADDDVYIAAPRSHFRGIALRVTDLAGQTWQLANTPIGGEAALPRLDTALAFASISLSGAVAEVLVYAVPVAPECLAERQEAVSQMFPPRPPPQSVRDTGESALQPSTDAVREGEAHLTSEPKSTAAAGTAGPPASDSDGTPAADHWPQRVVPPVVRRAAGHIAATLSGLLTRHGPSAPTLVGETPSPTQMAAATATLTTAAAAPVFSPSARQERRATTEKAVQQRAPPTTAETSADPPTPTSTSAPPTTASLSAEVSPDDSAAAAVCVDVEAMRVVARRYCHGTMIQVLSMAVTPTHVYAVTEWMAGRTLRETVSRFGSRLALASVRKCCVAVLRALDHLHNTRGVVHGRIHPDNILFGVEGNCKMIGMLYLYQWALPDPALHARLTRAPAAYCSPEMHLSGAAPTAASDIYAFGLLLLQMLTGEAPWTWAGTPTGAAATTAELLTLMQDDHVFVEALRAGVLQLRQYGRERNAYIVSNEAHRQRHEQQAQQLLAEQDEEDDDEEQQQQPDGTRRLVRAAQTRCRAAAAARDASVASTGLDEERGEQEADPAMLRVLEGCLAYTPSQRKGAAELLKMLSEM